VGDHGSQVAGYLATYLLPLLVVPTPSLDDLVAYSLFLIVAGLVYVRSEMVEINPTLYVLGFRVLRVVSVEGFVGYAIVRSGLRAGDTLHAIHVDAGVLVEVPR
jgi:hypothetical protein